jgi:hypothetical protein
MAVDDLGRLEQPVVGVARRHQAALVAERPGVEDGRELADDGGVLEDGDPPQHLVLGHPDRLAHAGVGAAGEGQAGLERVQQLPVELVRLVAR